MNISPALIAIKGLYHSDSLESIKVGEVLTAGWSDLGFSLRFNPDVAPPRVVETVLLEEKPVYDEV